MHKKLLQLFITLYLIVNVYAFFQKSWNDRYCVSECLKNSRGRYKCRTDKGPFKTDDRDCSPFKDTTSAGIPCRTSHSCDKHGYRYYWCYTDDNDNWDYCGVTINANKTEYFESNTYRAYCIDDCNYHGYRYQWCNTLKGWDYCDRSSLRKIDKLYVTRYGDRCVGDCKPYDDYFKCDIVRTFKDTRWDYCSKYPLSTYKSEKCRKDHPCGKYGSDFYWCYIDHRNNWQYCSPLIDCSYSPTDAFGNDNQNKKCMIEDRRYHSAFTIAKDSNEPNYIWDKRWDDDVKNKISEIELNFINYSVNNTYRKLYTYQSVDIDLNGFTSDKNFAKIIISKTKCSPMCCVTIYGNFARILAPVGVKIPDGYVSQALMNSYISGSVFRINYNDSIN